MDKETNKISYKRCNDTKYGFESRTCSEDIIWSEIDVYYCSNEFKPNNQSIYKTSVELLSSTLSDIDNLILLFSEYFNINPNFIQLSSPYSRSVEQNYLMEIYCEDDKMLKTVTEMGKQFNANNFKELQEKYGLDIIEIVLIHIVDIKDDPPSESSLTIIIGCVAGAVVLVIIIISFFTLRKRKRYAKPTLTKRNRRTFTISHVEFTKMSENRSNRMKKSITSVNKEEIAVIVPIQNI